MIGQVDGCRRQGRPRLRWMDSIKENTGFGLEKLNEIVKDRKNGAGWWRKRLETGNEQILKIEEEGNGKPPLDTKIA